MDPPPSTVTLPREYLWLSAVSTGRRHSAGVFSQAFGRTVCSTVAGSPMSARTISPHRSRPGSSLCPGLSRKNVTVRMALGAVPRTWPVAPSSPLGTSTATTRDAARSTSATGGSISRASPAPNTASITRAARDTSGGGEQDCGSAPSAGGGLRVAFRGRQCRDRDRPAPSRQHARGDVAIAAVVAGAAQHQRAAGRQPAAHRPRDRSAGVFHELPHGRSHGNGGPIGKRGFGGREQFVHGTGSAAQREWIVKAWRIARRRATDLTGVQGAAPCLLSLPRSNVAPTRGNPGECCDD